MNAKLGHTPKTRGQVGQCSRTACTLIEMLLVVAIGSVVCTGALRAVANQRKAAVVFDSMIDTAQKKEAGEWSSVEIKNGARVWVREF